MTSKRELVFKAIRGEEVERVPVGFWFHFVTLEEKGQGLNNEPTEKVIKLMAFLLY